MIYFLVSFRLYSFSNLTSHYTITSGMNNVLQVNVSVPLNRTNFSDNRLYNYILRVLDPEGNLKTEKQQASLMVPISVICYSRKVVGQSTEKLLLLDNFAEDESLVTGKDGLTNYNVSHLRKILRDCFTDERSSRNVQAMYETSAYINHQVQDDLLCKYNKNRTNLQLHLFEDIEPSNDRTNFNIYYLKHGLKNDLWTNLFADRKEDYDLLVQSVESIPDNSDNLFVDRNIILEFRDLVKRWYPILDDYLGQKGDDIPYDSIQRRKRSDPHLDYHKYYAIPRIPKDEEDTTTRTMLLNRLEDMKEFFHSIEIFLSIVDGSKKSILALDLKDSGADIGDTGEELEIPITFDINFWYKHCQRDLFEQRLPKLRTSVIDCQETFQGPKLQYPAGWQKMVCAHCISLLHLRSHIVIANELISFNQRYYWKFISCFLKLAAIREREMVLMEKHDCACFIAYCAITSNGSSDIAEITRRVSEMTGLFPNRFEEEGENDDDCFENEYCVTNYKHSPFDFMNMYESLFHFSNTRMFHAPGSCKQNRHVYCSGGRSIYDKFRRTRDEKPGEYPEYLESNHCPIKIMLDLFEDCIKSVELQPDKSDDAFETLKKELENKVEGIGGFNVHHVIHLSALLGLIPLKAFGYATLEVQNPRTKSQVTANRKRGPVKLIQASCYDEATPNKMIPDCDVQIIFLKLYRELCQIFGKNAVQKSLLENKLCELNRIFQVHLGNKKISKSEFEKVSCGRLFS